MRKNDGIATSSVEKAFYGFIIMNLIIASRMDGKKFQSRNRHDF